jgi:hypothetical protein
MKTMKATTATEAHRAKDAEDANELPATAPASATATDLEAALDVSGHVNRHPYGSVAAAVGIGYVLGGGIFTPLTARIVKLGVRLGWRLAVLPLLEQELVAMADSALGGAARTNHEDASQPPEAVHVHVPS